ncbi:amidohydrolase [Flavobacterium noncentrifugens]|nr:amidohydrolase [Flavobacterium noncentrifugens]
MKIVLIQAPLVWENPEANRSYFLQKIAGTTEAELIVLPEMFSTGFTMHPKNIAETMDGESIRAMKSWAAQKNAAVAGSVVIEENGHFYNRLVFVFPSGEIKTYDKRHLFSLAGEEKTYTPGSEKLIVEYLGWKICLLVCYDLRFPVFSRNVEDYDLLVYVANWPKVRINAWDILLKARAVENLVYTVGVNRVGFDGNGHEYSGHSQVVDFLGNEVLPAQENEGVFVVEIDKEDQNETRKKLGFLNDKDLFVIEGLQAAPHPNSPAHQ